MVRHAFAFGYWNFGGRDLDILIDLDRVAIDDLAVEGEGDFDSERAFAARSWADDRDDWRFGIRVNWRRIRAHVREDSTRKIATTQMSASNSRPPIIWLRENRTHRVCGNLKTSLSLTMNPGSSGDVISSSCLNLETSSR